ncbi:protein YpfM [Klebsiella pneumoniae]|uniref:protein YpfM n=1 Tax=Klebsiella pneumoniae TaxID=573 RepID=UPI00115F521D
MPLRITPSVAEQEGQQTETEATGAPQKHHYTLNQQVGSITGNWKDFIEGMLRK